MMVTKTPQMDSTSVHTLLAIVFVLSLSTLSFVLCQEYSSFDGYYNNPHYPDWGSIDSPFLRLGGGIMYRDKTYQPLTAGRPNPRTLSQQLFSSPPSLQARSSLTGRTALVAYYGQQVFAELHGGVQAGCPIEYFNIPIPECDATFDPHCTGVESMPMARSRYLATSGQGPSIPRVQLADSSPWIDGGTIYGNGKTWADALRERQGGRLKSRDENGWFPAVRNKGTIRAFWGGNHYLYSYSHSFISFPFPFPHS